MGLHTSVAVHSYVHGELRLCIPRRIVTRASNPAITVDAWCTDPERRPAIVPWIHYVCTTLGETWRERVQNRGMQFGEGWTAKLLGGMTF